VSDVHYLERGAGPLLVCLHGIGSSSASFQPQLDELGSTHHVVAWDAPGYGASADPDRAPGLEGYVAALADLIGVFGERAYLLGVSWGGVLAVQAALQCPELLRSLILIDSSSGSGGDVDKAEKMRRRPSQLAEMGAQAFARDRGPRLLSADADPTLVEQTIQLMAASIRLPGYAFATESMATTDHHSRLGEVNLPTLVLCGDQDTVTGPEESWALASAIPDAVFVSISGAGHLAHQERPASVNAWVASYVQIVERLYS
jgi:3-oxoadipate enol-lactonase